MGGRCGLVDDGAACRCERQGLALRDAGRPVPIQWASADEQRSALAAGYRELSLLQRIAIELRSPQWHAPAEIAQRVRSVIAASPMLGGTARDS